MATKTAIIVLSKEGILIWAIPPLSPQPLDFLDHNATHIPSLLRIACPDVVLRHPGFMSWNTISYWYFGSSQPLYFDILLDSTLHRFKIIVKPDLYDTALHFINTSEVPRHMKTLTADLSKYKICEGTLVACWHSNDPRLPGIYARFANVISHGGGSTDRMLFPMVVYNYSLCPASGRLVNFHHNPNRIAILDFF